MIIVKTLLASEIHPEHSPRRLNAEGAPSLRGNSPSSFTLSTKARKILAVSLPAWYFAWSLAPFLPEMLKPDIDVVSLVDWDRSLFGWLPHQVLHEYFEIDVHGFPVVDFMMALPYSLHVFWPILFVVWCAKNKRWGTLLAFVNCFGIASFTAVLTELVYPCAPPWYFEKYGIAPANYSLPGDPGTLSRVDAYFQGKFYYNTFYKSPLVFGAFPSLHVGWPMLLALFIAYSNDVCTNQYFKAAMCLYFAWVCFAVVYLQHHYVVDVIGGATYSLLTFHLFGPHRDAPLPPPPTVKRT